MTIREELRRAVKDMTALDMRHKRVTMGALAAILEQLLEMTLEEQRKPKGGRVMIPNGSKQKGE